MGVNARSSVDPRFQRWADLPLDGFKTAVIQIIDPQTDQVGTGWNPWDNASAIPTGAILWQGKGQLQVFRQTLNAFMPVGAITQIRSVRFTVPMSGPQLPVRKGLWVKVIRCTGDDDATRYQYTVTSGINSGMAFDRTIEAEADMGVVLDAP